MFRVIVESWVKEKAPEVLSNIKPVDRITVENNRLLQEIQKQAVQEIKRLFAAALKKKITSTRGKIIYISLLYAFLGDMVTTKKVIETAGKETPSLSLLEKFYNHKITPGEFVGRI